MCINFKTITNLGPMFRGCFALKNPPNAMALCTEQAINNGGINITKSINKSE